MMKRSALFRMFLQNALSFLLLPPGLAQSVASANQSSAMVETPRPAGQEQIDTRNSEDQEPPSNRRLTLEGLQAMARSFNPTIRQARASVEAAAGRTRQAGLWPNPTIGYVGDEIRGGSFGGGQHGVFLQQTLILGGKLGLDKRIMAQEGLQAELAAEEQRLRVESSVRIAFFQSLAAQEMVETRKKLSGLATEAVETTRQLFNVGQADQPDLLQAQIEADEAEVAVIASEHEQQRAWKILAAATGKADLPIATLEGNLDEVPDLSLEEVMQTILTDSPAMKIAQLDVTHSQLEFSRSHREVVPDLSVRVGYANNLEQLGTVSPRPAGSEAFAEVGVNLRLFNRNQGNIQAAKADEERAALEIQRVELLLRQLAAPAWESYSTSRAMVQRYKTRAIPTARQAYELYLQKYREGAAAYPQVLIAQRTFFQMEANYITALANEWGNAATLQGLLLTGRLDLSSTTSDRIGSHEK